MSNKELKRFKLMVEIEKGVLRIKDAANILELSRKQVSRIGPEADAISNNFEQELS